MRLLSRLHSAGGTSFSAEDWDIWSFLFVIFY